MTFKAPQAFHLAGMSLKCNCQFGLLFPFGKVSLVALGSHPSESVFRLLSTFLPPPLHNSLYHPLHPVAVAELRVALSSVSID